VEEVIALITALFFTLFDLDRTFYIPSNVPRKLGLYSWWWGFVFANGVLAAALYHSVSDINALQSLPQFLRPVAVGASYLALMRLKLTTFTFQGKDVPFGTEALYEAAKAFVYKRINRIAMQARYSEVEALANRETLEQLSNRAKLSIRVNALLTPEEKKAALAWVVSVVSDANSTDFEKRAILADFVLSGQMGAKQ